MSSATPVSKINPAPTSCPVAQPADFRVQVIRSLAEFLPLKKQWDDFLNIAGVENLCLTHAWLTQWLQHFPAQELLIIIVQDHRENWLAVAPLKISLGKQGFTCKRLRHLQFIGTQPNVYDWMEIVIASEQNELAVLNTIASVIRDSRWDVLDLLFMRNRAQCEALAQALAPRQVESAIHTETVMPCLPLPDSVKAYETTRRKKTRLEVNRHNNRFEKDRGSRPQLTFHTEPKVSDVLLKAFVDNHKQYWASRGQKSDFVRYPELHSFYRHMLEEAAGIDIKSEKNAPRLLLSTLAANDITLSYQLGFWQGSSYLSHLTNFNQNFRSYSPGTLHMDALVFHAVEAGATEFNFGRGDEPYKHLWTREKHPLWNLRLFRHPLAKALWALDHFLKKCLRKTAG
ncbi:GNAT family N-acetyltransferase [Vampirovibrio chlorellavorus]|uniref:GNAT family N-acetyltransferase n=1 Tax=Vampirovibrio chlorellavorus TaxID=758823 RepID=UPI0026EE63DB|nr:GNAT family N-acetyltransferase [Vampirovibrio chlorellavorus]